MKQGLGHHSIYKRDIQLMWSTKYRNQVLVGEVQLRCRDLLRQFCNALDVQILKGLVSKDPMHLHVLYPPSLGISELVRRLKGRSAKLLLQEFPEFKRRYWGGHFWGIGYEAWSVANVTDDILQAYSNHHKDRPNGKRISFWSSPLEWQPFSRL
ncbi:putative transposase [Hymenobacter sp. UYAg731]